MTLYNPLNDARSNPFGDDSPNQNGNTQSNASSNALPNPFANASNPFGRALSNLFNNTLTDPFNTARTNNLNVSATFQSPYDVSPPVGFATTSAFVTAQAGTVAQVPTRDPNAPALNPTLPSIYPDDLDAFRLFHRVQQHRTWGTPMASQLHYLPLIDPAASGPRKHNVYNVKTVHTIICDVCKKKSKAGPLFQCTSCLKQICLACVEERCVDLSVPFKFICEGHEIFRPALLDRKAKGITGAYEGMGVKMVMQEFSTKRKRPKKVAALVDDDDEEKREDVDKDGEHEDGSVTQAPMSKPVAENDPWAAFNALVEVSVVALANLNSNTPLTYDDVFQAREAANRSLITAPATSTSTSAASSSFSFGGIPGEFTLNSSRLFTNRYYLMEKRKDDTDGDSNIS